MRALLFAFGICFSVFSSVYAFDIPAKPSGFVNDYAELLKPDEKQFLEQELSQFAASTTNEIAVVTIPDLGGDTIEHYAVKLFEAWKIGKEKQDNGVLFLIARDDRKVRIEVGYGLEGALPDSLAGRIITDQVTPAFKNGEFGKGILEGVAGIIQATQNEYAGTPPRKESSNGFFIWMFVIFQGFAFLGAILGRSKSWWLGGVLGGAGGLALTGLHVFGLTLLSGGVVTGALVGSGLLFDYIVSQRYKHALSSGTAIPWWVGGGKFPGSSSSSFGGFGGGSSGGGGASGSW
jgi:uncharacterized protein